ncbi:MAG: hypothetical protein II755_04920 [Prevotella sp.]|nr:hypothetical protein [Prevotella sp.]
MAFPLRLDWLAEFEAMKFTSCAVVVKAQTTDKQAIKIDFIMISVPPFSQKDANKQILSAKLTLIFQSCKKKWKRKQKKMRRGDCCGKAAAYGEDK